MVVVGHVDHGKSTLLGRLFYETDSLPQGRYEEIQAMCKRRGMPFEWAFLTDALQAERDQGVTIDTTQIGFKTDKRNYLLIDAPGHLEFLRNMITGAATAQAAFLLIDASQGVREQTRRHGYLLSLLGVKQLCVVLNKMDLVGYDEKIYRAITQETKMLLEGFGLTAREFIPLSARQGDCVAQSSKNMTWYKGASLIEALDGFESKVASSSGAMRFLVQDVYKFDERRIIAGQITQGVLQKGDKILVQPSGLRSCVKALEAWSSRNVSLPREARAGEAVGVTLDNQIFVERGHVICHARDAASMARELRVRLFWLGKNSLRLGKSYECRLGTARHVVEITDIERVVDAGLLEEVSDEEVKTNGIADVRLRASGLVVYDEGARCVLLDGYEIAGGGIILSGEALKSSEDKPRAHIFEAHTRVSHQDRQARNGHGRGVFWLTGLSGSGKSTIAGELERQLFLQGYQVFMLDGDNLRHGLNKDLDFSAAARSENIRRAGAVATLMAQAGFVVLAAFIAPYRQDRLVAREAIADHFHEIYVKASVATCETRDPKGLYKKARQGEIKDFTGISAPYEAPENPEFVLDTEKLSIEEAVATLRAYVEKEVGRRHGTA